MTTGQKKKSGQHSKKPELRIVLDTNQLYAGSSSDLLNQGAAALVVDSQRHQDVVLSWYLPDVVKFERRYQMCKKAKELMPHVQKLERLLGVGLGISEEILSDRVGAAIDKQIKELGLQHLSLDTSSVDWQRVICDATDRNPPFEVGENEKGFRDAMIAESFLQLVDNSPKTSTSCLIVLVTADALLADTVKQRCRDRSNVRILASLDELQALINTVVSTVSEDFVRSLQAGANACFLVVDDQSTLLYKGKILEQIKTKYASEMGALPTNATLRKNGTWNVESPRFSKKVGQKIHWISTIRLAATAFRYDYATELNKGTLGSMIAGQSPGSITIGPSRSIGIGATMGAGQPFGITSPIAGALAGYGKTSPISSILGARNEVLMAEGQSVFEVFWHVTVTSKRLFVNPSVDSIEYVSTSWEGGPNS